MKQIWRFRSLYKDFWQHHSSSNFSGGGQWCAVQTTCFDI